MITNTDYNVPFNRLWSYEYKTKGAS